MLKTIGDFMLSILNKLFKKQIVINDSDKVEDVKIEEIKIEDIDELIISIEQNPQEQTKKLDA